MKHYLMFIGAFALFSACKNENPMSIKYPVTAKVDTTDHYFGTEVADPYRWLEDDNSAATKAWVDAQNVVTHDYINKIGFRNKIKERLSAIWNFPRQTAPASKAGLLFQFKNNGLQNQDVLYVLANETAEPRLLLDPNALSSDGTVALGETSVSDDGKYLGYSVSRGGSDWREIFVRNVETAEDCIDHLLWVKFSSIDWFGDGFFYSRYPKPEVGQALKGENKFSKVYFHKLGTSQDEDKLIYEDPQHPLWGFGTHVTDDKSFLVIYTTESTSGNAFYLKDLRNAGSPVIPVVNTFDVDYSVVGYFDGKMVVYTNLNAPNYCLMTFDPKQPELKNWTVFVPEQSDVLTGVSNVGNKLFLSYLKNAFSHVVIYTKNGVKVAELTLDMPGTVAGFDGTPSDSVTYFSLTTFVSPSTIYRYNLLTGESKVWAKPQIDFDSDNYETHQAFYPSKDGTQIPVFITHKKGLNRDGNRPTLLYGYGGFNISLTPTFSVSRLIWLENDGVVAVANLRGGGEFGEKWHAGGTLYNKQNVFNDFIAAGEYLIREKYTSSKRLTIQGGSNGGLLIGACVNQRPDLFAAALPAVGVMDMLRYHKFTIGRYWSTDYGTSADSLAMFKNLMTYSPVHTIKTGVKYPAVLVTTADHDDRVVPAHSFKYAATLQNTVTDGGPLLIRIEKNAGHGAGKPTAKLIEEYADLWSFAFYHMNFTPKY